jgi:hypothetical protein
LKTTIAAGATCSGGGIKIDVGLDNGDGGGTARNGTLETGEVDSTANVCNPAPVGGTYLFRAGEAGGTVLQRYTIASDTWATVTAPPAGMQSIIASDGTLVYAYLTDSTLRAYSPTANSWSTVTSTPPPNASSNYSILVSTPGGLYYCGFTQSTMNRYQGGTWTSITLPSPCGMSGTYDGSGKILIRLVSSNSFMVVDSATGTYSNTVTVAGSHIDYIINGSYYAGNWYTQDGNPGSAIMRADATLGGAQTSTGLLLNIQYPSSVTDYTAGMIYFTGFNDATTNGQWLVRFNPVANTLTPLTSAPAGVMNRASMVVVQ